MLIRLINTNHIQNLIFFFKASLEQCNINFLKSNNFISQFMLLIQNQLIPNVQFYQSKYFKVLNPNKLYFYCAKLLKLI